MNFRRWITALAVLTLFVGLAAAQTSLGGATALTCQTVAQVTPTIRSEGITELVGDIVITCQGGEFVTIGTAIPQGNIVISLTAPVTSRLWSPPGGVSAPGANGTPSEALLMVDEPNSGLPGPVAGFGPGAPLSVCPTPGSGCVEYSTSMAGTGGTFTVATNTVNGTTPGYNVFQGNVSGNTVSFQGIPFLPPVTSGVVRVYRITNVRVNATNAGGSLVSGFGQVQAQISTNGASTLPISQAAVTVAFVSASMTPSISTKNTTTLTQCNQLGVNGVALGNVAILNFAETFPSAFKTRIVPVGSFNSLVGTSSANYYTLQQSPGQLYSSESGFIIGSAQGVQYVQAGLADFGTRLKAVFNNLPSGATVYVTPTNVSSGFASSSSGATLQSMSGQVVGGYNVPQPSYAIYNTSGESGALTPPGDLTKNIVVTNTNNTAVWEVVNTNTSANETFSFAVYIAYNANAPALTGPATTPPGAGLPSVTLSYAPISSTAGASSSAPVPRFIAGPLSVPMGIIPIIPCQTLLLFPFVTSQARFDTGLAISNTSQDPWGTTTQTGSCTLNFYGANAPTTPTLTGPIPPGTTYTNTMNSIVPQSGPGTGFQGYLMATCTFQFAHGFAFVSDLGAQNLAMGYLPLIITNGTGPAPTRGSAANVPAEILEN